MAKPPVTDSELVTDEFIITRRFRTSNEFSLFIETDAKKKHITCLETLVAYCAEEDIDVESAALLVNASLKQKLEQEATSLHLLKKSTVNVGTLVF